MSTLQRLADLEGWVSHIDKKRRKPRVRGHVRITILPS